MKPAPEAGYQFGPFHYDPRQHLLFRDGQLVALMPKVADTLQVLLERSGEVVEKSELMKLVWPDTTVEEIGLARNISLLRKALGDDDGDDTKGARYIETIPRRGYRFVALLHLPASPALPAPLPSVPARYRRWLWPSAAAVAIFLLASAIYWQFYTPSKYLHNEGLPGLAVVPFECLASGPECPPFAEGVSALIVTDLAKVGGMSVVAPSTVRRHQHIGNSMGLMGRLLGLQVLVEGTVQKLGDRMKITARLVDVHTGKIIWGDSYDLPAADWDNTETNVAREIAAQVSAHLAVQSAFPHASR
jgi:DNA-binding winged helix-turn-helix (wHTH) protein/TolB-like protein